MEYTESKVRLIDANKLIKKLNRVTLKNGMRLYIVSKRDIDSMPTEKPEKHLENRKVWDVSPDAFVYCERCKRVIDVKRDRFCRECGLKQIRPRAKGDKI